MAANSGGRRPAAAARAVRFAAGIVAVCLGVSVAGAGQRLFDAAPVSAPFFGPFASWLDIRRDFHATGDGEHDDTDALQAGLDAIVANDRTPVLFLPAGTYRISRTLTLRYGLNVAIIGADPETTRLVWDGERGGTMFDVVGVAYSQIARLTFDGRQAARVAVEQRLDGKGGHFDTGNEYADVRFLDVGFGLHGGFGDGGFAETSIVRARFLRNTEAGLALGNFNALDAWVWQSRFEDCGTGVTNEPGAGNFRVYDSVFLRSAVADMAIQNTGSFTARGNVSIGSRAFFVSGAAINHPALIDLQGNTILDVIDPTPIRLGNQGPGLMLDNVIAGGSDGLAPAIRWRSTFDVDVASIGNAFTARVPLSVEGRLMALDNRRVDRADVVEGAPPPLAAATAAGGPVFEVGAGADGEGIQDAIDRAAAAGSGAIVHIPAGRYAVDRTIVVPAGDVRIVGDGYASVLRWSGEGGGPVLRVLGPTRAWIDSLLVNGASRAEAVVIEGVDQPGARVWLDGVQLRRGGRGNLVVDGLDAAAVDARDIGHSGSRSGPSVFVAGGPRARAGEPHESRTVIYSGASSDNVLSYEATGGAELLVRDIWYEGPYVDGFLLAHGRAHVTVQGARAAAPVKDDVAALRVEDLTGTATILTTHIDDRVSVSGDGREARVLALGLFREAGDGPVVVDTTAPPAAVYLANGRQRVRVQGQFSVGTVPLPDVGRAPAEVVRAMLSATRAWVSPPTTPVPPGATSLTLHRVALEDGARNLVITR